MSLLQLPFVVIRHGQTDANRDAIVAGRVEAQLTDLGQNAARALADWDWPINMALFVSPQERARDTARLGFPNMDTEIMEGLRERNWGRYEGHPVSEMPPREHTPEGGEAWADMLARVATEITKAQRGVSGKLPVFVAHSGVIRAVRELTGGISQGTSPANTTPYLYTPRQDGWVETYPDKSDQSWVV